MITDSTTRTDAPDLTRDPEPVRHEPPRPTPPRSHPTRWPSQWRPRRPSRSGWIVLAIAALTAGLYTWHLSNVGTANSYYTAAVKAGSVSWKAFFFGSLDPGSFITVDKPPAALWVMELSARLFGFSNFTMLLPQAFAGVASVLMLHRLVRKWMGDTAAHIAALALAITPVAAEMFRYNNPDALLTFFGLAAASALWSALETGRTRALVFAAVLTGFAFNTKMLQAYLVVPAFILVYLIAGKPRLRKRIGQLFAALVGLVLASSWWVAIVAVWPADSRPYIGGTNDNSILGLVFGYNGLSRVFGGEAPGGGAGPGGNLAGGGGFGGSPGWLRLFNLNNGGQISWLLPFAAVSLVAGLWYTRRRPRRDRARAGWMLWGGWALVCFLVFSLSSGIYHEYYTVQLAPAVAALVGAGAVTLWRTGRRNGWLRMLLPVVIVVTAAWAIALLDRTPSYEPWLRTAIVVGAALTVAVLVFGSVLRRRALVVAAALAGTATLLAAPAAFTLTTISNPQRGPIVLAGPSNGAAAGFPGAAAGFPGANGPASGGLGTASADAGLVAYLEAQRGDATYLVAAFGAQASAPIIIASGQPVITIGGFTGSDPAPTLAQLQHLIATGQVRYVLVGGAGPGGAAGGPGGPGGGSSQSISAWVTAHGTEVPATAYGGGTGAGTLYDVRGAA